MHLPARLLLALAHRALAVADQQTEIRETCKGQLRYQQQRGRNVIRPSSLLPA
jgi:hypothetical protein